MKTIIRCCAFLIFLSPVTPALNKMDYGKELLALSEVLHNTCLKLSGTTQESIDKIVAGEFLDDEKIKKYVICCWLESTVLDKNGRLNMDLIMKLSPSKVKDSLPKNIKECWTETKELLDVLTTYGQSYGGTTYDIPAFKKTEDNDNLTDDRQKVNKISIIVLFHEKNHIVLGPFFMFITIIVNWKIIGRPYFGN